MKKKFIDQIMDDKKIRKQREMQAMQLKASCDHKKEKNGRIVSALKPISDDGQVLRCTICEEKLDLHEMEMEELRRATKLVKNAIEAIKVSEDDIDEDILLQFGMTKLLLERLDHYYKDLVLDKMHEDDFEDATDFGYNPIQAMMGGATCNPMYQMVNDPRFMYDMYGGGKNNKHKKNNKYKNNKKKKNNYNWY